MIRATLAALLSHWRRHPVQLAMLILGLSLATALWSGVQAINAEARASYAAAAATLGGDRLSALVRADGAPVVQADYVALRRAGWLVSPVLEGEARFGAVSVRLLGIDPLTLPTEAQVGEGIGSGDLGVFITPPGVFYGAAETLARLKDAGLVLHAAAGVPPGVLVADIGVV